jgi:hypothetical protein
MVLPQRWTQASTLPTRRGGPPWPGGQPSRSSPASWPRVSTPGWDVSSRVSAGDRRRPACSPVRRTSARWRRRSARRRGLRCCPDRRRGSTQILPYAGSRGHPRGEQTARGAGSDLLRVDGAEACRCETLQRIGDPPVEGIVGADRDPVGTDDVDQRAQARAGVDEGVEPEPAQVGAGGRRTSGRPRGRTRRGRAGRQTGAVSTATTPGRTATAVMR